MLDGQGLAVSVGNDTAVSAYNKAVTEWLDYKISSMRTLKQAIELEPDFVLHIAFAGIYSSHLIQLRFCRQPSLH